MDEKALHELADSIKENGVIQPILMRKSEDGKNVIVAGERRFNASEIAGRKSIPGILLPVTQPKSPWWKNCFGRI
ncbi:MAG: ParB N-terminal domain-containing protein [Magnetococcus sp. DMHC-1]